MKSHPGQWSGAQVYKSLIVNILRLRGEFRGPGGPRRHQARAGREERCDDREAPAGTSVEAAFPLTGGCRVSDRGLRQNPAAGRDSSWGVKRKMLARSQQFFVAPRGIEPRFKV